MSEIKNVGEARWLLNTISLMFACLIVFATWCHWRYGTWSEAIRATRSKTIYNLTVPNSILEFQDVEANGPLDVDFFVESHDPNPSAKILGFGSICVVRPLTEFPAPIAQGERKHVKFRLFFPDKIRSQKPVLDVPIDLHTNNSLSPTIQLKVVCHFK